MASIEDALRGREVMGWLYNNCIFLFVSSVCFRPFSRVVDEVWHGMAQQKRLDFSLFPLAFLFRFLVLWVALRWEEGVALGADRQWEEGRG
jgi:hypothetical protein